MSLSFQFRLSCLTGYHTEELFNPGFHGPFLPKDIYSRPFTWMPAVDLSEPGQENNNIHIWLRACGKYCPLQIETTASFQTWTIRYLPVFLSQWCQRTLISWIYMDSDQKDLKTEQGFCTWTFIPTGLLLPTCIPLESGWPLRLNSLRNSIQLLVQPHWTHKMVARLDAVAWNTALRTMNTWNPKTGTFAAFDLLITTCRNAPSL